MKHIFQIIFLAVGLAFFPKLAKANVSCKLEVLHSSEATFGLRDLNFSTPESLSWLGLRKIADGQIDWSFGSVLNNLKVTKTFNMLSSTYAETHMSNINGNTYVVASDMPENGPQATWFINKKDFANGWINLDSFQFPTPPQATDGYGSGITPVASDHLNNLYVAGCITFIEGTFKTNCLVRKSSDDGATWKTIHNFPTDTFSKINSLQISSTNRIFIVGEKARQLQTEKDLIILKASQDFGNSWEDFAEFTQLKQQSIALRVRM